MKVSAVETSDCTAESSDKCCDFSINNVISDVESFRIGSAHTSLACFIAVFSNINVLYSHQLGFEGEFQPLQTC